jgi:hypothetical protein
MRVAAIIDLQLEPGLRAGTVNAMSLITRRQTAAAPTRLDGRATWSKLMPALSTTNSARLLAGAAFAIGLCLLAPPVYAQSAPFSGMAGAWSGDGRIDLQAGTSEPIRCRATYAVGGDGSTLQQQLRCASESYRFEVSSNVQSRAGSLSGSWSETTRNVSGVVSGRVAAGRIQARVDASPFVADLTVHTNGNHQSVLIVPQGSDVKLVAVTMRK